MVMLEVAKAGLMVTVQAKPRTGYLAAGVSPSGPMDEDAFRIAQALAGNGPDAAALEFAQFGGSYRVSEPTLVAVTGGAAEVQIDGRPVPCWESHRLEPGARLDVGVLRGAIWGYIAFSGGIDVPLLLGSRTTHVRNAMGGFEGRSLVAGDRLALAPSAMLTPRRMRSIFRKPSGPIRVIAGPQDDYFDARAWSLFLDEPFAVSTRRDRMASLLFGPALHAARGHDIISDGTPPGSIQVPGSGTATVLTAERQTTGGYPKIATVISADLPRLAQMPGGLPFRFAVVEQEQAEDSLLSARKQADTVIAEIENG
ncbi:biotin-dependent carboxyltransferase family protein [Martelella radicis]|uniref:Allophanate hydrolase n=1 Tax=Martelella radicis TaxID=1397476 RepID=A0A7W6KGN2_9HYPH|nr:biotin-dependent carboxyltransferase family protein [Martelella radicis]MBB4120906.1 allophanate hydrolase [Martelella radicis]